MPGRRGRRSPVRKISELSGRLRFEAPVRQLAVPDASLDTELMTHVLVGVLPVLGIGNGGPKRQPSAEHVRCVAPTSPDAAAASVRSWSFAHAVTLMTERPMSGTVAGRGTVLPPPPK